jgi:hypothetical protein
MHQTAKQLAEYARPRDAQGNERRYVMSSADINNYQMANPPTWNPALKAYLEAKIASGLDKQGGWASAAHQRRVFTIDYKRAGKPTGRYTIDVEVTGYNAHGPGGGQYSLTLYDIR